MKTIGKHFLNFLYFFLSYFCFLYLFELIFGQKEIFFQTLHAALIFASLMTFFSMFIKNNNAILNIYNLFSKRENRK
ncbi:hypothetical protein SE00_03845 [Staphylococcus saprophyticus]|uniref:Uncharacterized protein n=1 Tax=Staphylococcus saprophyticus TaxID=29385 RepID=A0A380HRN0_STASA|nr:hypothetical protein [Staphylococcus saprophyticus]KIJ87306.1 hypothetical protein SE00_03845 [Staphylococcus saprophyticus]MDW3851347.1 hypothetical protein [Staphylococcus saprophyticus]MEB8088625.1 hypothetical protein [Staphylococcus saprophyticus]OEK45671.1 hypothetical protein ASS92_04805 [Staphylococcus saprophyticus]OEK47621.1 hypothetical protein ASS91_01665 [Staphylococcus saprophyticus]